MTPFPSLSGDMEREYSRGNFRAFFYARNAWAYGQFFQGG